MIDFSFYLLVFDMFLLFSKSIICIFIKTEIKYFRRRLMKK